MENKQMHGNPFITVAMAVYNGEAYLAEAISSILSQTYSNFEFIIVDDGSQDGSLGVLRDFEMQDKRICVISQENQGLSNSLNRIIQIARGTWLARMDADDIALPARFENQLKWLSVNEADICGGYVQLFGNQNRLLKHAITDAAIKAELLFDCAFAHPSILIKTEVAKLLKYDSSWDKAEDYELWTRAALAGYKLTNVPKVLLNYRTHASQVSSASFALQKALTNKLRLRYWINSFESGQVDEVSVYSLINLRDANKSEINLDHVKQTFDVALASTIGEAREVVWEQGTRLYFRAVTFNSKALWDWVYLSKIYCLKFDLLNFIKLTIVMVLKIKSDGYIFSLLKKVNFSVMNLFRSKH